jgi:hypothetical protein
MYERCIFQSAFNLVGALHAYPTIGDVARFYPDEVNGLSTCSSLDKRVAEC